MNKKPSQKERLLAELQRRLEIGGAPITPLEALNLLGIMRLAARVNELRAEGYEIVNVNKRGKYAAYKLEK